MLIEITPKKRWKLFGLSEIKELWHYGDLLYMLILREISVLYKQTVLGFAWAILKPLFQVLIFTVIFGKLAGLEDKLQGSIPYAVFSFAALVPWTYFSTALSSATGSLIANEQFLTKVYFPRIIIPITPLFSKLVDFAISLVALFILEFAYGVHINSNIVFLPLFIFLMFLAALGLSLWLSALAIQFRDVQQMIQFLLQILLYAAPIIWPLSSLPNKVWLRTLYGFYPMAGVIEGFRASITGGEIPWLMVGLGTITSVVLFVTGSLYFRSREDFFADIV